MLISLTLVLVCLALGVVGVVLGHIIAIMLAIVATLLSGTLFVRDYKRRKWEREAMTKLRQTTTGLKNTIQTLEQDTQRKAEELRKQWGIDP